MINLIIHVLKIFFYRITAHSYHHACKVLSINPPLDLKLNPHVATRYVLLNKPQFSYSISR